MIPSVEMTPSRAAFSHSQMVGKLDILSKEDYAHWLAGHKTDNAGSPGDRPADVG